MELASTGKTVFELLMVQTLGAFFSAPVLSFSFSHNGILAGARWIYNDLER